MGHFQRQGRTEEGALALRMRSAVSALRWREDSAKGGGLLGPPSSHDTDAEEGCFMGTAPRLNSTILRAGAFLPLLLHHSDNTIYTTHTVVVSAQRLRRGRIK